MKAIILAGGLGTRISEETADKPKPMVEIAGVQGFLQTAGASGRLQAACESNRFQAAVA